VPLLPQSSIANEEKVTVRKVDPKSSVRDAFRNSKGDCAIIVQNGHSYEICPYKVTPEIQSAVRSAIEGLR
jgi:hypothetical protein